MRVQEQLEDYYEDDHETPAFLMNSIEDAVVPSGTITTYNLTETDDFVAPELILDGKEDSGKEDSGKEDSGKEDSGKEDSGKEDSGKEDHKTIVYKKDERDTKKTHTYVPPIRRSMKNKINLQPNASDTYDGSEEAEED